VTPVETSGPSAWPGRFVFTATVKLDLRSYTNSTVVRLPAETVAPFSGAVLPSGSTQPVVLSLTL
jgi:hypothetical protein